MTICVAWTRTIGDLNELLMAADSRLIGGGHVDYCPKIFSLPREDSAIGFCGHTTVAYPFILQVTNYINAYAKARSRALDFVAMRRSLINILNDFRATYIDAVPQEFQNENETTEFIVSGWSWRMQRFEIFKITYAPDIRCFSYRPTTKWRGQQNADRERGKKIAIAGDYVEIFRRRLIDLLRQRNKLIAGGFDMEPFEVLRDMLRDENFIDRRAEGRGLVGGAPQLIKIYPHPNVLPIGIYWGNPRRVHVFGRPLLEYELTTYPILDPETLNLVYPLEQIDN